MAFSNARGREEGEQSLGCMVSRIGCMTKIFFILERYSKR